MILRNWWQAVTTMYTRVLKIHFFYTVLDYERVQYRVEVFSRRLIQFANYSNLLTQIN